MPPIEWIQVQWLYALIAVPLVIWLLHSASPSPWRRHIDSQLLQAMTQQNGRNSQRFGAWLTGLILALAIVMLAGPSVHTRNIPLLQRSDVLAIVLDMSESMNAVDPTPSRLKYATYKVQDALDIHSGEAMLAVWSGDAHLVIPPTHDKQTIINALRVLQTDLLPTPGDRPAEVVELALKHIPKELQPASRILLLTDGASQPELERLQTALSDSPMQASILIMGSQRGGFVRQQNGRFQNNSQGKPQLHTPDFAGVQQVAQNAGARVARMSIRDNSDLSSLLDDASAVSNSEHQWRVLAEIAPWGLPALAVLFALLIAWGRVPGLMLALCVVPLFVLAEDSYWLNDDQNAWNRLQEEDAAGAAIKFDDSEWKAYSYYRSGNHQEASRLFSQMDSERSLYNLGTSLAHAGDLQGAADTLEKLLEQDSQHEDAHHNLEIVRKLLDQQQEQQQQQQSQGRDGDDSEQDSASDGQQGQEGEEAESQQQAQQGNGEQDSASDGQQGQEAEQTALQPGEQAPEPGDDDAEAKALEEAEIARQAIQLEYVEPDPGGLLRRRFKDQRKR